MGRIADLQERVRSLKESLPRPKKIHGRGVKIGKPNLASLRRLREIDLGLRYIKFRRGGDHQPRKPINWQWIMGPVATGAGKLRYLKTHLETKRRERAEARAQAKAEKAEAERRKEAPYPDVMTSAVSNNAGGFYPTPGGFYPIVYPSTYGPPPPDSRPPSAYMTRPSQAAPQEPQEPQPPPKNLFWLIPNLFYDPTVPPDSLEERVKMWLGRILTVIWVVCYVVIVLAVVIYYATSNAVVSNLKNPSLEQVQSLRNRGLNPLCACENAAQPTKDFVTFSYTLEPICSFLQEVDCDTYVSHLNTLYYFTEAKGIDFSQLATLTGEGDSNYYLASYFTDPAYIESVLLKRRDYTLLCNYLKYQANNRIPIAPFDVPTCIANYTSGNAAARRLAELEDLALQEPPPRPRKLQATATTDTKNDTGVSVGYLPFFTFQQLASQSFLASCKLEQDACRRAEDAMAFISASVVGEKLYNSPQLLPSATVQIDFDGQVGTLINSFTQSVQTSYDAVLSWAATNAPNMLSSVFRTVSTVQPHSARDFIRLYNDYSNGLQIEKTQNSLASCVERLGSRFGDGVCDSWKQSYTSVDDIKLALIARGPKATEHAQDMDVPDLWGPDCGWEGGDCLLPVAMTIRDEMITYFYATNPSYTYPGSPPPPVPLSSYEWYRIAPNNSYVSASYSSLYFEFLLRSIPIELQSKDEWLVLNGYRPHNTTSSFHLNAAASSTSRRLLDVGVGSNLSSGDSTVRAQSTNADDNVLDDYNFYLSDSYWESYAQSQGFPSLEAFLETVWRQRINEGTSIFRYGSYITYSADKLYYDGDGPEPADGVDDNRTWALTADAESYLRSAKYNQLLRQMVSLQLTGDFRDSTSSTTGAKCDCLADYSCLSDPVVEPLFPLIKDQLAERLPPSVLSSVGGAQAFAGLLDKVSIQNEFDQIVGLSTFSQFACDPLNNILNEPRGGQRAALLGRLTLTDSAVFNQTVQNFNTFLDQALFQGCDGPGFDPPPLDSFFDLYQYTVDSTSDSGLGVSFSSQAIDKNDAIAELKPFYEAIAFLISSNCSTRIRAGLSAALVDADALKTTAISSAPKYYTPPPRRTSYPTPTTQTVEAIVKQQLVDSFQVVLKRERALQASKSPDFNTAYKKLFIDNAGATADYKSYFEQCKPSNCAVQQRPQPITVAGLVLGILGGAKTGLDIVMICVFNFLSSYYVTKLTRYIESMSHQHHEGEQSPEEEDQEKPPKEALVPFAPSDTGSDFGEAPSYKLENYRSAHASIEVVVKPS